MLEDSRGRLWIGLVKMVLSNTIEKKMISLIFRNNLVYLISLKL